jgi:hypothetical protein
MSQHEAARTLVKSPPELWETCSDPESLGRHLHAFGEIRITRLEPETTVAWEGERASGTVRIEPSGWGTKVTLTVDEVAAVVVEEPVAVVAPPVVEVPPVAIEAPPMVLAPAPAPRRGGLIGWLSSLLRGRGADAAHAAPPLRTPIPGEPELAPAPVAAAAVAAAAAVPVAPEPVPAPADPAVAPLGWEPVVHHAAREQSVLDALAALEGALDSLGQAHHRPFSRG